MSKLLYDKIEKQVIEIINGIDFSVVDKITSLKAFNGYFDPIDAKISKLLEHKDLSVDDYNKLYEKYDSGIMFEILKKNAFKVINRYVKNFLEELKKHLKENKELILLWWGHNGDEYEVSSIDIEKLSIDTRDGVVSLGYKSMDEAEDALFEEDELIFNTKRFYFKHYDDKFYDSSVDKFRPY